MDLPLWYKTTNGKLVCKLNKSFMASGKHPDNGSINFHLPYLGMTLPMIGSGSCLVVLLVYVDDIILAGPDVNT